MKPERGSFCLQDPQDSRVVEVVADEGRIIVDGGRGVTVEAGSGVVDDDDRDSLDSSLSEAVKGRTRAFSGPPTPLLIHENGAQVIVGVFSARNRTDGLCGVSRDYDPRGVEK